MIPSLDTQKLVFETFGELFHNSHIPELRAESFMPTLPKISLDDTLITSKTGFEDEGIFDILGYFRSSQPDSVYLCPLRIQNSASKKNISSDSLALIVYIHEVAHYFHFHADEIFNGKFSFFSPVFRESFAQLLTHKIVDSLDTKYNVLKIFLSLIDKQPLEYRVYKDAIPIYHTVGFDDAKKEWKRAVKCYKAMCLYRIQDIFDVFIRKSINHPIETATILDKLSKSSTENCLKENDLPLIVSLTGDYEQYDGIEAFLKR